MTRTGANDPRLSFARNHVIRGLVLFSPQPICIAAVLLAVSLCGCSSQRDRAPIRDSYVVRAYHYCEKCGSLQGGVYEKGPFKTFSSPDRNQCVHAWQEISRERFMQLATQLHGMDWSQESGIAWRPSSAAR